MATKGTPVKSTPTSSPSTSVETRLKALEAQAHPKCDGGIDADRLAALEAKVDDLIGRLSKQMDF
jgi:hypothetical protein